MSLTSLDGKGTDICEYQRKIVKLKQHATGLQTFLSLKQLEIEVSCKNKCLHAMGDTESLINLMLAYSISSHISRSLGMYLLRKRHVMLS